MSDEDIDFDAKFKELMKTQLLIYLLTISLIGTYCKNKVSKEPVSFPELVQQAYLFRNDERFPDLCNQINDSISSSKTLFEICTLTDINEIDKTILWVFAKREKVLSRVSDRLVFRICIKNENDLFINGIKSNISEVKRKASEYIFLPDRIDRNIVYKKSDFRGIGEVDVSRVVVYVCCDIKKDKGFTLEQWNLFFNCIHEVILVFEDQKNTISIEKIGRKYDFLSFEEKKMFADIVGYSLVINFFNDCDHGAGERPVE